uniref:Uncharacterized protein n=1 Tax=viral metagenome TaxID=1070528 RepID=A0A6C0J1F7_9ZZZZ
MSRQVYLEAGLNSVKYVDNKTKVGPDTMLYLYGNPVGMLKELRDNDANNGSENIGMPGEDPLGTVDTLENKFTAEGGKRKSLRGRKSNKSRKATRRKATRRKATRRKATRRR